MHRFIDTSKSTKNFVIYKTEITKVKKITFITYFLFIVPINII